MPEVISQSKVRSSNTLDALRDPIWAIADGRSCMDDVRILARAIDAHVRQVVAEEIAKYDKTSFPAHQAQSEVVEALTPTCSTNQTSPEPTRLLIPRMGIYETDESIKDRLKAACAAEGLVAVDKLYLADLEMIVRRWLEGDETYEDTQAAIKRINDVWNSAPA